MREKLQRLKFSKAGLSILLVSFTTINAFAAEKGKPLTIDEARVAIAGADVNPPDFQGWGGPKHGIGWPGGLLKLPKGELLFFHSAGYWHSSFPTPSKISKELNKRWSSKPWYNWPWKGEAPRGGRIMVCRSADGGRTWSKPETVLDTPFDDRSTGAVRCEDGTLVCTAIIQGRWAGFKEAPKEFQHELDGLAGRSAVVLSKDNGKNWSEPIWLESPGKFQENGQGKPILLPDDAILWPTYCQDADEGRFFGAIRRSDDCGKTWKTVSKVQRTNEDLDEAALLRLSSGRLLLVCRPDGGILFSDDEGKSWKESGLMVDNTRRQKKPDVIATPNVSLMVAPQLMQLKDGAVVCVCSHPPEDKHHGLYALVSRDQGMTWTKPFAIAPESYGYPADLKLEDDSILVAYLTSAMPPARMYLVHIKINEQRTGVELLPLGNGSSASAVISNKHTDRPTESH